MQVFETIFPIVAIAVLGYGLRKYDLLNESEASALEKFTFNYLVPSLLFLGTATAELPETMDWSFLFSFYGAILVIYILGIFIGSRFYRYGPVAQSVFGMGCAYSNVTVLGIPISLELVGDRAFVPLFILISIHNLSLFAFGTFMAERKVETGTGMARHLLNVVRDLLMNPITGSLIAGGMINLLGVPIYQPVMESISLMSRAAIPAALFVLGAALTRYQVRGEVVPAMIMVVSKLFCLPALVWLFMFHVFPVDPVWGTTAVILASMPVGISVYVFSHRYRSCENQAAAAIVLSAVLSVVSISFFSYLLGLSPPV